MATYLEFATWAEAQRRWNSLRALGWHPSEIFSTCKGTFAFWKK